MEHRIKFWTDIDLPQADIDAILETIQRAIDAKQLATINYEGSWAIRHETRDGAGLFRTGWSVKDERGPSRVALGF